MQSAEGKTPDKGGGWEEREGWEEKRGCEILVAAR